MPPRSKELYFPRARTRWSPAWIPYEIEPRISTQHIFTLKLEVFDETGDPVVIYVSTKAMVTGATDGLASTTFRELINDPGTVRRQVFGNGRSAGIVSPSWGSFELNNNSGNLDYLLDYSTDGGKVTCMYGPYGGSYPAEWRKVYIAYIDGQPTFDAKAVRFNLRGREKLFEKKVVTAGFTNNSGLGFSPTALALERNGIPGARLKQIVMGQPGYFEPILTNDLESIWFVQDNAYAINGVGTLEAYDGGVNLPNGTGPGTFNGYMPTTNGPLWFLFGTEPRVEVRVKTTGYYATPTVTARRWTICDLASLAGIGGVDPNNMPTGSVNFDCGNRLVETQSFKDVLSDIAQFEVASIGFDRLDRFYARRIEPSFANSATYTFTDGGSLSHGNSRNWTWAPIPGLEKRVWQVGVHAGATKKSAFAGIVEDDIRDALSRDPWNSNFVVDVTYNSGLPFYQESSILDTDPTAVREDVEIVGNEFPSSTERDAWALRYMRLHGAKQAACSLEAEFNFDTLQLELLDTVTLQTNRFGGSRQAVIWSIDAQLKQRKIRFGCWSHRQTDAPGTGGTISIEQVDDTVGSGGGSGPSGGARGGGDAAPQIEQLPIDCSDKTTALTVSTLVQAYIVPYDFYLTGVGAALYAQQTTGSIFTLDMKATAVSFLSTLVTIDNSEYSSFTAATQPVVSSNVLLKGTRVTFNITQLGTGAKGLTAYLIGYQI